jgi:hypothetical protein
MPPDTVYVGRPTKWGNPFRVGPFMTRASAFDSFKRLLGGYVNVSCGLKPGIQESYHAFVSQHIRELRGKNLACWCSLDQPCHADVLLALANDPALIQTAQEHTS